MDMTEKRSYQSRMREQSKLTTLDTILSNAVRLHGKGVTSLEVLAEEAGVSVATIRKYFPTREDLFKGCTEHFAKNNSLPSLYELSQIDDPADRLAAIVGQIYDLLETAMGPSWLAYRLEGESPVMASTVAQVEGFIRSAVDVLLHDWKPDDSGNARENDLSGFVRGMLSPLTYRSLRLFGGLQKEHCIKRSILVIAKELGVEVTQRHLILSENQYDSADQPMDGDPIKEADPSDGRQQLKTVNLNRLPLLDAWHDNDPSAKWKANLIFTSAFPLWTGIETDSLSAVVIDLEPGYKLGEHTDSAEELVLVMSGTVEASLNGVERRLNEGEMLIIPAMVPHEIRNVGMNTARCLGFFANKQVTSTFIETVNPMGLKQLPPDEG